MKQKNNIDDDEIRDGRRKLGIAGLDGLQRVLIFLGITIFLIALVIMFFGRFL